MNTKGLVLEGGGMRGIFTAGVLDFFLENNVEFDNVIGVSAGSCHACSFLSGQHGRAFDVSVNYLDDKRYCSVYSLITTGDLFGAKMLYEIIPNELYPIDNEAYLKNKANFYAVVTNCETGEAQYPQITDMKKDISYIRASSSLPLVSRMVEIGGKKYLDGGIADSIPVRKSIEMGNVKNVVVLTQHESYRKEPNSTMALVKARYRKYPELIKQIGNRHINYNNTLDFISEQEKYGNLFVIRPSEPLAIKRIEKDAVKLRQTYETGYNEAKRRFDELVEYLKK